MSPISLPNGQRNLSYTRWLLVISSIGFAAFGLFKLIHIWIFILQLFLGVLFGEIAAWRYFIFDLAVISIAWFSLWESWDRNNLFLATIFIAAVLTLIKVNSYFPSF